jgi:rod shape-determining protein MreB
MPFFRQELAIDLGTANTVIFKDDIWLAGGGSLLRGIAQRFTDKVNIQFRVAEDPLKAVARGTCLALKDTEHYPFLMR